MATTIISIRLPNELLTAVKTQAKEEGIPYQTLIRTLIENNLSTPIPNRVRTDSVYFIQDPDTGLIKIGFSTNPYERIRMLTYKAKTLLDVLLVIRGPKTLEKRLHQRFNPIRVQGEWFKPEEELLQCIDFLKEKCKRVLLTPPQSIPALLNAPRRAR